MTFLNFNSKSRIGSLLLLLVTIVATPVFAPIPCYSFVVQEADSPDTDEDEQENNDSEEDDEEPYRLSPNRRSSRGVRSVEQYSKRADSFVALFKPVVESASQSMVQVYSGGRQLALGLIVDSDGLILTKASELKGELKCQMPNGKLVPAEVYGIHSESDLAMLRVRASSLSEVQFASDPDPQIGQWVASPLPDQQPLVGIVSVNTREIPPSTPFIGIQMTDLKDRDGVRISFIVSKSPADDAGLWVNDVITKIDSSDTIDIDSLRDVLGQYDPNERITLTVMRGDSEKQIKLTLAEKDKVSPQNRRSNQQNSMGSRLSRRRKAFPNAFQHDSMLTARNCGGPVVNLQGQVIGINIARAGRVANYSLPVATIKPILAELKTGNMAPEIVNKEAIEKIDLELKENTVRKLNLQDQVTEIQRQVDAKEIGLKELDQVITDLQKRRKKKGEELARQSKELSGLESDLKRTEQVDGRLHDNRKLLSTGRR